MKLLVKQLKLNNLIFVPQTVAEAVLVKHNGSIKRLDIVLELKVETVNAPENSGLKTLVKGPNIEISHINEVVPNTEFKPLLIKHDNTGHITETASVKKLNIIIDNNIHVEYDGSTELVFLMGDDFTLDDNNKIKLNWNNL